MNARICRGVMLDIKNGRVTEPSMEELRASFFDGTVWAACPFGCEIPEPDGYCEHGRPSWLAYYGIA